MVVNIINININIIIIESYMQTVATALDFWAYDAVKVEVFV